MVTTGAIRRAQLQSNHYHQQTNIQLFTGRIPFMSPNQQCQSTEGKAPVADRAIENRGCYAGKPLWPSRLLQSSQSPTGNHSTNRKEISALNEVSFPQKCLSRASCWVAKPKTWGVTSSSCSSSSCSSCSYSYSCSCSCSCSSSCFCSYSCSSFLPPSSVLPSFFFYFFLFFF